MARLTHRSHPEFIPFLGPLDDAVVAALVLRHVLRTTDRSVLAEHWRGDPSTLDAITRSRNERIERPLTDLVEQPLPIGPVAGNRLGPEVDQPLMKVTGNGGGYSGEGAR